MLAFFCEGTTAFARNDNGKTNLINKISGVGKKPINQKNKNTQTFLCCVESTFNVENGGGFCCTTVTIESCASSCAGASQQNSALLVVGWYMGYW